VERDGSLYLSVLRSCSGWPSGVWIDPPQRSAPDGSNFQFQHWSHTFGYALATAAGDWRSAETVRIGHEFNNPLDARLVEAHEGDLPATASFVEVEPASVVMTVLKPFGNALARQAGGEADAGDAVVLRLYESSGLPADVTVRGLWPFAGAEQTDLLEESTRPAEVRDGEIRLALEPFEIATIRARLQGAPRSSDASEVLAPRIEPAQPVFADYWQHNKGSAPLGYQPVSVQIRPSRLEASGPFKVPITVASERTDAPVDGSVVIEVPPGWQTSPAEQRYRLAPGEYLAYATDVAPAADATAGRYFVSARIAEGEGSQEDVVAVDLRTGLDTPAADTESRSRTITLAVERALVTAGLETGRVANPEGDDDMPGEEVLAELLDRAVAVSPGQRASLRLSIRNCVAGQIRGEAQIISPYDTWGFIHPWTQGFAVEPGEQTVVEFSVAPPPGTPAGAWWALIKVMHFGRLLYTESIPVEVVPS
jgi:hypothetical protein